MLSVSIAVERGTSVPSIAIPCTSIDSASGPSSSPSCSPVRLAPNLVSVRVRIRGQRACTAILERIINSTLIKFVLWLCLLDTLDRGCGRSNIRKANKRKVLVLVLANLLNGTKHRKFMQQLVSAHTAQSRDVIHKQLSGRASPKSMVHIG